MSSPYWKCAGSGLSFIGSQVHTWGMLGHVPVWPALVREGEVWLHTQVGLKGICGCHVGRGVLGRLPGGGDIVIEPGLSKGQEAIVQAILLLAFPWAFCVPLYGALDHMPLIPECTYQR